MSCRLSHQWQCCQLHAAFFLCSALYFYCNRPTVAAIITMGVDVGAAASAAFGAPEAAAPAAAGMGGVGGSGGQEDEQGPEGCQLEGETEAAGGAATLAQQDAQQEPQQPQLDQPQQPQLGVEEALDQVSKLSSRGRTQRCDRAAAGMSSRMGQACAWAWCFALSTAFLPAVKSCAQWQQGS